jgi:hypothetical protein
VNDVEVHIVTPRPGVAIAGGDVSLRAHVAVRAQRSGAAEAAPLPAGWALAISLDDDGESTVVPGGEINGKLPALPPGAHTIIIALIDTESGGTLLGPRAKVASHATCMESGTMHARRALCWAAEPTPYTLNPKHSIGRDARTLCFCVVQLRWDLGFRVLELGTMHILSPCGMRTLPETRKPKPQTRASIL